MRICAVTVSVNYADYLELIVENRYQFDRWIIVTASHDQETQRLCRNVGIDHIVSNRLYEGGAVFHKAAALNEGIANVRDDDWVVVLDSDILLPRSFRDTLEELPLCPGVLYGLIGRRVCLTKSEYFANRGDSNWRVQTLFNRDIIGYFHLFSATSTPNRYPEQGSDDASAYDLLFSESFPVERRSLLPMTCLHLGPPSQNWRGRRPDQFDNFGNLPLDQLDYTPRPLNALLASLKSQAHGDRPRLQQPLPGADRLIARRSGLVNLGNELGDDITIKFTLTARRSWDGDSAIQDAHVVASTRNGGICIADDLDIETLIEIKNAALESHCDFICGARYGHWVSPEYTVLVSLIFGAPDIATLGGQWVLGRKSLESHCSPIQNGGHRGVVGFIDCTNLQGERAFANLSHMRDYWPGPFLVFQWHFDRADVRLLSEAVGANCQFTRFPFRTQDAVGRELGIAVTASHAPFLETLLVDLSAPECLEIIRSHTVQEDWPFTNHLASPQSTTTSITFSRDDRQFLNYIFSTQRWAGMEAPTLGDRPWLSDRAAESDSTRFVSSDGTNDERLRIELRPYPISLSEHRTAVVTFLPEASAQKYASCRAGWDYDGEYREVIYVTEQGAEQLCALDRDLGNKGIVVRSSGELAKYFLLLSASFTRIAVVSPGLRPAPGAMLPPMAARASAVMAIGHRPSDWDPARQLDVVDSNVLCRSSSLTIGDLDLEHVLPRYFNYLWNICKSGREQTCWMSFESLGWRDLS